MAWQQWALVALIAASTLSVVGSIGRPREPLTPGVAVAVLVTNVLMIWAVVTI